MEYRKEIDGLRALAVVPVLLFHAGIRGFSGGFVGVDIFFVISGYLITGLIVAEQSAGKFSLARFYERRVRRILPALMVVMVVSLVPAWLLLPPGKLQDFGQSLIAVAGFSNNILLALTSGYFAPATDEKPLLHTWSLSVEEQYYIVYPALILLCWAWGKKRLAALIAVLAVLSLAWAEWGSRHQSDVSFYAPQTRAWELLVGAMIALAGARQTLRSGGGRILKNVPSIAGLLALLAAVVLFDERMPYPSVYTLLPVVGTGLLLATADQHTIVGKFLRTPLLVGIGLMSYSLYLWHQPLLAFARVATNTDLQMPLALALLAASACLAYLSWRYVELPVRNRRFLSRRTIFVLAGVCSCGIATVGVALQVGRGFPQRMPAAYLAEFGHFRELESEHQRVLAHSCYLSRAVLKSVPLMRSRWNCQELPATARLLVMGDSHAWDKALALRLNGIPADQVTGPNCSLVPSLMRYECRQKFDAVFANAMFPKYQMVLLANRWHSEKEVTAFAKELAYWKSSGIPLVLFGPMPEFGRFADRMSYLVGRGETREQAVRSVKLDVAKLQMLGQALQKVASENGITYVDTAKLFCGLAEDGDCQPLVRNEYLIFDYAHLSVPGAKLLGSAIAHDLELRKAES